MGTQRRAEVSFFHFPLRQFTFFQRVSNQRSFSFPLRGWSLLNVVLLVTECVVNIENHWECRANIIWPSDSNKVRCTGYPGPDSSSQSFAPLKNALLEWWCLIGYGEEVECWLSLKVACHQGWLSGCYTRLRSKSSWNRNPQMIPFSMAADQNTAMKNTCSCLTQIKIQIT